MIINPWASLISQVDQDPWRSDKARKDVMRNGKACNSDGSRRRGAIRRREPRAVLVRA